MGFIIHFYIIFGTNLSTEGLVQIVVFLPISLFHRKGISNGIQTEWNLRDYLFWNKRNPEDLELKSRTPRGGHEAGRRAEGGRCTPTLVGPSQFHRPTSFAYIYSYTLKTSGGATKPLFHHRNLLYPWDPIWGLFRWSAGGGFDHGGLLHQHHSHSDDVWVVYLRPTGP